MIVQRDKYFLKILQLPYLVSKIVSHESSQALMVPIERPKVLAAELSRPPILRVERRGELVQVSVYLDPFGRAILGERRAFNQPQ